MDRSDSLKLKCLNYGIKMMQGSEDPNAEMHLNFL